MINTFSDGAVGLQEVGLQESIEQIARETLDGIINRQNVDSLTVLDVGALVNRDDVTESDAKVGADDLVHANLGFLASLIGQNDANSVSSLLALNQNSISTEKVEGFHSVGMQANDGIVILRTLLDHQSVWRFLSLQNGSTVVLLTVIASHS
jgi:hypothetical protein